MLFYRTLYNLLRLDLINYNVIEINRKLEPYGLQAFEYRTISRTLNFINKIASNTDGPLGLKQELERTLLRNENYMLRSNNNVILKPDRARTKFGDLVFKNICSRIVMKIKCLDFYGDSRTFKSELYLFDGDVVDNFVKIIPSFNIDLSRTKYYK